MTGDHLADALAAGLAAAAETPRDVVPRPAPTPILFTPGATVEVTWPGEPTYDVDGTPTGIGPTRTYSMTVSRDGSLAAWLPDDSGDAA